MGVLLVTILALGLYVPGFLNEVLDQIYRLFVHGGGA
jgi:hypothetical protein